MEVKWKRGLYSPNFASWNKIIFHSFIFIPHILVFLKGPAAKNLYLKYIEPNHVIDTSNTHI